MTSCKLLGSEESRYRKKFSTEFDLSDCTNRQIKDVIKKLRETQWMVGCELADIIENK